MKGPNRRRLLKGLAAASGIVVIDAWARPLRPRPAESAQIAPPGSFLFTEGVASGDPQPDRVVLWTRARPASNGVEPVTLTVQISQDPGFASVLADHTIQVGPESDYCARIVMRGLTPATRYFYRFRAGSDLSMAGRTLTAPEPGAAHPFRFAFASCQNFEQAFYGAWARMLADDQVRTDPEQIAFVLFLGDFIYEVRGDRWDADMRNPRWLKGADGRERAIPPFPDGSAPWPSTNWNVNPGATNAVTLADYRHLYRLYLSDPNLQAARARWPFIQTWDDHEFSNDGWQSHDTYFDNGGTPAQARKVAANQAWFEYVPCLLTEALAPESVPNPAGDFTPATVTNSDFDGIKPDTASLIDPNPDNVNALASMTIYRAVRWGALGEFFLTDNRSYKSPPLSIPRDGSGKRPALPPIEDVRIMDLGRTARANNPPRILPVSGAPNPRVFAAPGSVLGQAQKSWFKAALKASDAKWRFWANAFPALPIRLDMSRIPFSGMADACLGLDAWNGYPAERRELMDFLKSEGIANVVALAGDHHMHLAGILVDDPDADDPQPAAIEFAVAGISSEPVFPSVVRATASNRVFRAIATYESAGRPIENWNFAMTAGVRAALIQSLTGSLDLARMDANPRINPGLRFADTNANGFGLVAVRDDGIDVTLISTANPETDFGQSPAPLLRSTAFAVKPWSPASGPVFPEARFEGTPPFPFGG